MITKIELNNYCIFKGKNTFEFDESSPNALIVSPGGSGKTTVFSALLWCLYGYLPRDNDRQIILNFDILSNASLGQYVSASVIVTVRSYDEIIVLERHAQFERLESTVKKVDETVLVNAYHSRVIFDAVVERLFPLEIYPYFIWNERIDHEFLWRLQKNRAFSDRMLSEILRHATRVFNKVYFRDGQYEIVNDNGLRLHRIGSEYYNDALSEDDEIVFSFSVLYATCQVVRMRRPEVEMPIIIDLLFSRSDNQRMKKIIEQLMNSSKMQVLIACHEYDYHQLDLSKGYKGIGKTYSLERSRDGMSSSITEK